MDKIKVYIAGPYTKGDVVVNVRKAVEAAEEVVRLGFYPFIPHMTHLWHMIVPHNYDFWLDQDFVWLLSCDALLRIPGESSGADKEVALAKSQSIPVFDNVEEMRKYFNTFEGAF